MKIRNFAVVIMTAVVALLSWSCDKEPAEIPVERPTIGIMEPELNAETMEVSVMIAPSSDATAWYWYVEGGNHTDEAPSYNKVEGAAAKKVTFKAVYGVEYTITAYAENKAGRGDFAEKRFCAMPEGEVAITIGELSLNEERMEVEATIYPSKATSVWYWGVAYSEEEATTMEWIAVEGNKEQTISFPYEWGKRAILHALAECGDIYSEVVTVEAYFTPAVPTITISKPHFDEASMTVSFDVTPSEDTHHWWWGPYGGDTYPDVPGARTFYEDNAPRTVSYEVEYDIEYEFTFRAENAINEGESKVVEFCVISPVADITIENLTAYTLDAVVTKKEHCVRYVAGAVHTSAYDRNIFVEQAQASLNPDPSYPFAIFNSATESRRFSEQDLVRNSLTSSNESAGIILLPKTSYTIAIYGEDSNGRYTVTTKEVVIPEVELNGNTAISVEVSEIGLTSAKATVTTEVGAKVLTGYIDPALAKADAENPFDFEGKTEAQIKAYIASAVKGVPMIYSEPLSYELSNIFAIDSDYVAYGVAIKDGKVGEVAYTTFRTLRPSLTGEAKIISAEIEAQTSHERLSVKLSADTKATKVRLYAAPASDHSAYADNLEYIMDADSYQNYREEYDVVDGVATCEVNIYHPAANYYIYASAVDANGRAGEMVCVARLAGLDTDYVTTIEEVIDEGSMNYNGTGDATLVVEVINISEEERISAYLTATNFSDNVDTVWFIRYNGLIEEVEEQVKSSLAEYNEEGKVIGSYKVAFEDWQISYVDGGSSWDPKYEALQAYDNSWGGDIIVMVILDTEGKVKIHSYYAAGREVVKL